MKLKLLLFLLITSCTFSPVKLEIKRGEESEEEKNYKKASIHYSRAIKRGEGEAPALYAAKKLVNISLVHLDDIEKAKFALNYILLHSDSLKDKKDAIERLAKIEYEKIRNYEKAIEQFQRLLTIEQNQKKRNEIQYLVARSYFYMNRLYQAEQELDQILDRAKKDKESHFKAMTLKANIYHAKKDNQKAADTYLEIMEKFPKLSLKEKVWLNLSICYEDMKKFEKAIELLKDVKQKVQEKVFIEEKIVRLEQRQSQEPGARGLRK